MWDPPPGHPIRRMFAGLTEHAFLRSIGLADPPLIDYLSSLLSRFLHSDTVFRLRNEAGLRMSELSSMVIEAEKLPEGRTCREYHRHIGDFALFWSGLFPEAVNRFQFTPCKDHVVNFTTLGKRSYRIASRLEEESFHDESAILFRLSEQFELCAYGLREVRRDWEDLASQPLPPGQHLIGME
jgi:hypothetical protein